MSIKRQWVDLGVGVILVVVVVLGFGVASEARSAMQCASVVVESHDHMQVKFLTHDRLLGMLRGKMGDPVGHSLLSINTHEVESMVSSLAPVAKCDAYVDMDGRLCVMVKQREAIARVMPRRGESWYIARDGYVFTAMPGYVSPALVVSGAVRALPAEGTPSRLDGSAGDFYSQLYGFLREVYDDAFWRAQIAQVYVRDTSNVELVPRVGSQIVLLGEMTGYEYKLRKLRSLYAAALPGNGLNQYDRIELRYGKQVVCKRK